MLCQQKLLKYNDSLNTNLTSKVSTIWKNFIKQIGETNCLSAEFSKGLTTNEPISFEGFIKKDDDIISKNNFSKQEIEKKSSEKAEKFENKIIQDNDNIKEYTEKMSKSQGNKSKT